MGPIPEIVAKTEWWDGERKGKEREWNKTDFETLNRVFALSVRITA